MTTRQLGLFDAPRPIVPRDPNVPPAERKRLGRYCRLILDRLREGPATTDELRVIYYKFTQRIWDLREFGCVINREKLGPSSHRYTLTHEPEGLR